MGHLAAEVDGVRRALDHVEVLAEALPPPRDALDHGRARDVLDALHEPDEPLVPVGARRREADAAAAHHHRGAAVEAARREVRVPRDLRVEVRVDVDEAGRDQLPARVDLSPPLPRAARGADLGDDVAVDRDVRLARRPTRAVHQRPVPNDQVVHEPFSAPFREL